MLRMIFRFICLLVVTIIGIVSYTPYAKTFGIVGFDSGGYVVFNAPAGTYIPERAITLLRLIDSAHDYTMPKSVVPNDCSVECIAAGQSPQLFSVSTANRGDTLSNNCGSQQNLTTNIQINKKGIVCSASGGIFIAYELAPDKIAAVVVGSEKDSNNMQKSIEQAVEIVNNSEFSTAIFPKATFLRPLLPSSN
jgi:hypothetical protein